MYCSLIKLMVSNAMDSGRPIPGVAARHLTRCDSCREFADMAGVLEEKLMEDARSSGITLGSLVPEPITLPSRPLVYRPAFAIVVSCMLLLIVAVSMIYVGPGKTGPENDTAAMELFVPSIGGTRRLKAIDGVFAQELASLTDDAQTAANHVLSVFPASFGHQDGEG